MSQRIYEAFLKFHNANPHVYERLRELALLVKSKGRNKYSINGLFEVLRWEQALTTTGSKFKLNNNFRAWYARMLEQNVPELSNFFELRKIN